MDSILAGVSYGQYNIPALTDAIVLTADRRLALGENRLDAMMHFAISRQAMYRQVYQHRVLLACDTLGKAIVLRARDLGSALPSADAVMREALAAATPRALSLEAIFWMRESWWRYHLAGWSRQGDAVLADLADRMLHRRLLKTIRVRDDERADELRNAARAAVAACGYDPRYYLHEVSTIDMNAGDSHRSMLVNMDDGRVLPFNQSEPLYDAMLSESKSGIRTWLALPEEAKRALGRER